MKDPARTALALSSVAALVLLGGLVTVTWPDGPLRARWADVCGGWADDAMGRDVTRVSVGFVLRNDGSVPVDVVGVSATGTRGLATVHVELAEDQPSAEYAIVGDRTDVLGGTRVLTPGVDAVVPAHGAVRVVVDMRAASPERGGHVTSFTVVTAGPLGTLRTRTVPDVGVGMTTPSSDVC